MHAIQGLSVPFFVVVVVVSLESNYKDIFVYQRKPQINDDFEDQIFVAFLNVKEIWLNNFWVVCLAFLEKKVCAAW